MAAFEPPEMLRAVLVGSGSDGMNEQAVADAILALANTPQPRVLYLGAATYDLPGPRERQTARFVEAGCFVMSLDLATPKLVRSEEEEAEFGAKLVRAVEAAGVIVVSGGNTLYAADRFVKVGLVPLLRRAMERGVVLTGGSAGAICWFDSGHSDSMDPGSYRAAMLGVVDSGADESSGEPAAEAEPKPWEYIRIPCLGLLPGLCCPHHDRIQSNGVLRAVDFDEMMLRHRSERGLAIDHWAALVRLAIQMHSSACHRPVSVSPTGVIDLNGVGGALYLIR
jgi:dipeptidase E